MSDPIDPSQNGHRRYAVVGDPRGRDGDQTRADAEQTASDSDQTASDSDENAAASDEASAFADQQGSDRDQAASDSDQATADRDETAGGDDRKDTRRYEQSRDSRAYSTDTRTATTARRGMAQNERLRQEFHREQTARRRDENAATRDRIAEQRDRTAAREDQALAAQGDEEALIRVLRTSELVRNQAAADRTRAADDRVRAALDREQAADERRQARVDVQRAQLDSLTGVYMRDLGRVTLQHEIDRCKRSGEPFVLGFIDIDGLKAVNDTEGHAAGDALIKAVVEALKSELRSYDPIVRIGGDEFLCGFVSAELEAAQRRAQQIHDVVEAGYPPGSISIGLAVLGERDTLESLTARADLAMYASRPPENSA